MTSASQPPSISPQTRVLLTSLVFLGLFIITLIILIISYPILFAPPPTATATVTLTATETPTITLTPTVTLTPTPSRTPRPTWTPTHSPTITRTSPPSQTPTPTALATLTPAAPLGGEANYVLYDWNIDRAQQLVELIQSNANLSILSSASPGNTQNLAYALFAEDEALLRFPDAPQAARWRLWRAHNLALLGSSKAGAAFAEVIAAGLNQGQTDLSKLTDWIMQLEPSYRAFLTALHPRPDTLSLHLLELQQNGSAFFLIIETNAAYQVYPLWVDFGSNQVNDSNFGTQTPTPLPSKSPRYQIFSADLTNDGSEELILYRQNPVQIQWLELPHIYNQAVTPPQELPFDPIHSPFEIGMTYTNGWDVQTKSSPKELVFKTRIFPTCPAEIQRSYRWDGKAFQPLQTNVTLFPYHSTVAYCAFLMEHARNAWGPSAAIQVIQSLLPYWPPALDLNGKPYPPDAKDELRYRLGVYQAEIGEYQAARDTLQDLLIHPSAAASRWLLPAKTFLDLYKTPTDVYRACTSSTDCHPGDVLQQLIESFNSQQVNDLLPYFQKIGLILRSTGYFDFDGNGSKEFWFTVQHRAGEKIEFWALIPYGNRLAAVPIETVDNQNPVLSVYDNTQNPPVILLNNQTAFQIQRTISDSHPYVSKFDLPKYYPDKFKEHLQQLEERLFIGDSAAAVYQELLLMQKTPGLLCKATWSCDRYYYLLGLSAELSGNPRAAIAAYYRLWWDYSKSPFTTMARLKLRQLYVPSPTPTQTFTATVTPTSTSVLPTIVTVSTPTRSTTPNPNQTATATSAPLPTNQTAYPSPTMGTPLPTTPYP